MKGRRLPDRPIGGGPPEDAQPGDYWKVLTHDGSRPLDVHNPEDRYWGTGPEALKHYAENLTGGVWGVIDPSGRYGMLSIHTVREEEDGTISVRPGDGSSNSIFIRGGSETTPEYHGYIEHGEWGESL
jgi:hypothetical protein